MKKRNVFRVLWGIIRNNIGYKIIALLSALLIWGVVMSIDNPYREKTIRDVKVSFTGMADLNAAGLVIVGNQNQILSDVRMTFSIRAQTPLNRSDVSAYIELQNIRTTGKHTVRITGKHPLGSLVEISPATVEIEVDKLVSRPIPIQIEFLGKLPDNYWKGPVEITPSSLILSGPQKQIERIKKAVCYIRQDDLTVSFGESVKLVLMDDNDVVMDDSSFVDSSLSVIASMQVLPKKTVPLEIKEAVVGEENIPENYEILAIEGKPESVEIAAPQDILDKITSLSLEAVKIEGAKETVVQRVPIIKPYKEIVIISGEMAEITVQIQEKQEEIEIFDLPIRVIGLGRGLEYEITQSAGSINLFGAISQINRISRSNISLYVDIKDLEEGRYSLPVQVNLSPDILDLTNKLEPKSVTVTISKKQ